MSSTTVTIIVAVMSLIGSLVGTFAGIATSTKLTVYRIEQLEKKVEKHNSVVERTIKLEKDSDMFHEELEEIKMELRVIKT